MPRKVNRRQQLIRLLSEMSAGDVTSIEEMNEIIGLKTKLVANTPPSEKSAPKKKGFKIVKSTPTPQPAEAVA
jgi:hypothetical protein